MQQQFKQLKCSRSLRLEEDMPVIWPKQDKPGHLKVSKIIAPLKNKKAYAFNMKVIAFISEGELYVTPYSNESLLTIRNAGYKLYGFFVPFSNGDKPLGEYGEKWRELVNKKAAPTNEEARWAQPVVASA